MEMMLIVCELVVAVCTLAYLFSLQHLVDSGVDEVSQSRHKDVAFGSLSLAFTLPVLAAASAAASRRTILRIDSAGRS